MIHDSAKNPFLIICEIFDVIAYDRKFFGSCHSHFNQQPQKTKESFSTTRLTHANRNCIELNVFGDTAILIDRKLWFYFYMEISLNSCRRLVFSSSVHGRICLEIKKYPTIQRNQFVYFLIFKRWKKTVIALKTLPTVFFLKFKFNGHNFTGCLLFNVRVAT